LVPFALLAEAPPRNFPTETSRLFGFFSVCAQHQDSWKEASPHVFENFNLLKKTNDFLCLFDSILLLRFIKNVREAVFKQQNIFFVQVMGTYLNMAQHADGEIWSEPDLRSQRELG